MVEGHSDSICCLATGNHIGDISARRKSKLSRVNLLLIAHRKLVKLVGECMGIDLVVYSLGHVLGVDNKVT